MKVPKKAFAKKLVKKKKSTVKSEDSSSTVDGEKSQVPTIKGDRDMPEQKSVKLTQESSPTSDLSASSVTAVASAKTAARVIKKKAKVKPPKNTE